MNESEKKEYQSVVLGALLHDIGKFMQRAHYSNNELPASSYEAKVNLCPLFKGNYSHHHVLWTDAFYEWVEKEKLTFPNNFDFMVAKKASIYHHQPDHHPNPSIGWICAEADRLSSGMDRKEKDEMEELARGRKAFKKIPLQSIFDRIDLGNHEATGKYFYSLTKLSEVENIFPVKTHPPFEKELDYLSLWKLFLNDFRKTCSINNAEIFLNSIASLMEEYTWAIPSSTMDLPDISLFDHSITTAAIASAMYQYHVDKQTFTAEAIRDRILPKFRIVAGDISGIQNFIFRLQNQSIKGVNKILRARSFYVRSITEMASHWILKRLGLPDINKVMDAGGRFFLLVPDTETVLNILDDSIQIIEQWMQKEFLGELALNMNYSITACGKDFNLKEGRFASLIDRVNDQLELCKNQKFLAVKGPYTPVYTDISYSEEDGFSGLCSTCGSMPAKKGLKISGDEKNSEKICEQCNLLVKLGGDLPSAKYMALYDRRPAGGKPYVSFFDNNCFLQVDASNPIKMQPAMIFQISGDYSGFPLKRIANYVPRFHEADLKKIDSYYRDMEKEEKDQVKENLPKTFHHLGAEARRLIKNNSGEETPVGKDFLGLFKADVDNLGLLFSIGLEREHGSDLSISRYSFMSRMLDIFFAHYLQHIIQKDFRNIYTVFSGGDDLFLIGPWTDIVDFSSQVNESFRRFTCWNKDITLSAGVELIKPRYPVNRGAAMAEEALEKAKYSPKNQINLFKTTVSWEKLPSLMEYAEKLDEALADGHSNLTISMIYRLLVYHEMQERLNAGTFNPRDFLWRSHLTYDIERNIRKKKDQGRNTIDSKMLFKLAGGERESDAIMPYLKIPVFWTLYRTRS